MIGKRSSRVLTTAALLATAFLAACAGDHPQTTFQPVTDFGELINGLFYNTTLWTMAILLIVEGALVFILFRYRARPGAPDPEHVHGNTAVEIVWTVIPAIIVAFIAVPAVKAIFVVQRPEDKGAFEVEVIGHQWWWEFRYPELPGVMTGNELHVPTGRSIYLTMRSADVVHSFWIPRLGGKRDVNPQPRTREGEKPLTTHLQFKINTPGEYDGQCAEFCGDSHGLMRMRVVAQTPEDFQRWVAAYKAPPPEPTEPLAIQGKQVLSRALCSACHTINGTPMQGKVGPDLTLVGDRWAIGAGLLPNTPENLAKWITDPGAVKPGVEMPGIKTPAAHTGFPPTNLTPDEVKAVAAYLSTLKAPANAMPAGGTPLAPDSTATAQAATTSPEAMAEHTHEHADESAAEHAHGVTR